MEHFEELWEEAGGGICGKRACEGYYREALEWVCSWLCPDISSDDAISIKIIEKELKNE